MISAIPPQLLKTAANPGGTPIEVFDQLRSAVAADRSQLWKDFIMAFYGYNRSGAKISEGVRESFWLQSTMAGLPNVYLCIKAFSDTDLTEDLKKFDVPTLVVHGEEDPLSFRMKLFSFLEQPSDDAAYLELVSRRVLPLSTLD